MSAGMTRLPEPVRVDLEAIRRKLRDVLNASEGVNFIDDEREILIDSLGRLRALLDHLGERMAQQATP
jgi:hypothetical protein